MFFKIFPTKFWICAVTAGVTLLLLFTPVGKVFH